MKDQDETFVGELLGAAVAILGTMPPPSLKSDKTAFSVHPKKVKLVGVITMCMSMEEILKYFRIICRITEDAYKKTIEQTGKDLLLKRHSIFLGCIDFSS